MKVLCYDFETNSAKMLCAVAAILLDTDTGNELHRMSCLVKMKERTMGFAQTIHGITKEMTDKHGLEPNDVINALWNITKKADIVVVHNYSCEVNVLARHLRRDQDLDKFIKKGFFCTKRYAKKAGYFRKKGDLECSNLYRTIFGQEQQYGNAHNPMVDVEMTLDIFCYFLSKNSNLLDYVEHPLISRVNGVSYDNRSKTWQIQLNKKYYGTYKDKQQAEQEATKLQGL